jgi:hypothetical protein
MGALSFKERFVEPVLLGLQEKKGGKRQSIRNFRKRPLEPGERLVLYYAQRTKYCRKLGEAVVKSRDVITITEDNIKVYSLKSGRTLLKKFYYTKAEKNGFARSDGFKDFEDMKTFWNQEHGKKNTSGITQSPFPYSGNLYTW